MLIDGPVRSAQPLLSIVVPFYNEAEGIDIFFQRIIPVLSSCTEHFEIICVDDGSHDTTLTQLQSYNQRDPRIKIISLSRNFGKDTALSAGLDHTSGQAVIPIDADLQDPPELIPQMLEKWREGYEVVFARRDDRSSDDVQKRVTSGLFYRIYNQLADISIPDNTGDFRLMDCRVVEVIRNLPEKTRFMKGLFAWVGFKQTGIAYKREVRAAGTSKWRYWKLWNFALDGITSSSTSPLRIWTYVGLATGCISLCYAVFLILSKIFLGNEVPGYASLMTAVLFLGAINIIATGIMGEYLGRIYAEVRNRPLYIIREEHGLSRSGESKKWTAPYIKDLMRSKMSTGGLNLDVES